MAKTVADELLIVTCSGILDPPSRIRGKDMADALCKNGVKALWIPYQPYPTRPEMLNFLLDFARKCRIAQKSSPNSAVMIQRYVSDFELNTWSRLARISRVFGILRKMTISSFCFGIIVKHVFKRRLVYDIDDALFKDTPFEVLQLLRISDLVVVGGYELYDYAKNYNKNVLIIPPSKKISPVHKPAKKESAHTTLTFVSGPWQLRYMYMLTDTLIELAKKYDFELRIMSASTPEQYTFHQGFFEKLRSQNVKVTPLLWSPKKEKEELEAADIGLAPLSGDVWERYKCGFKIINYMSEAVPPVASPFGENKRIIRDGYDGFLCGSSEEWCRKLGRLIEDKNLRRQMGQNALKTAQEKYSIDKNACLLADSLRQL